MEQKKLKIALAGNPNTGKTSLFNALTGLNQRVGNYPGITVDKKTGYFNLNNGRKVELFDLPGTYSLNPSSLDEEVVLRVLTDKTKDDFPDAIVFVADASNLKRNLYFFSQLNDLGIPTILVLNMVDIIERKGISIDIELLSKELKTPIVYLNARKGIGVDHLKSVIENVYIKRNSKSIDLNQIAPKFLPMFKKALNEEHDYTAWIKSVQKNIPMFLPENEKEAIKECIDTYQVNIERFEKSYHRE